MLRGIGVEPNTVVEPLERLGRIHWRVDGMKGGVQKPGPPVTRGIPQVRPIPDPPHRLGRHEFGGVALLVEPLSVAVPGVFVRSIPILVGPRVGRAGERAVGVVEAVVVRPPLGPRAEVPLSGLESGIASGLEHGGERGRARRKGPAVAGRDRVGPESAGVAARQQCYSRGRADRLHVVAVELHSRADELIKVWRLAEAAVPADIAPAEIVGNDQENVGPLLRGFVCGTGTAGGNHDRDCDHDRLD